MRILFSCAPGYGHLLPLLPLLRAARRAGHDTALLTHASVHDGAPSVPLLAAGPSVPETVAEVERRTGSGWTPTSDTTLAGEFFVEARMELGAEEALEAARGSAPDVVVADHVDFLGQYAAAALGVPWAAHGNAVVFPESTAAVMNLAAAARFQRLGVERTGPTSYLDPWPATLLRPTDVFPAERIPIRPEPHAGEGTSWVRPSFPGRADRPRVLVTLGTIVDAPEVVSAILESLDGLDVNVVVAPVDPAALDRRVDDTRVHLDGFVPMADLLEGVDVVMSAGGAGTVLSCLSAGLPMVLLPLGLDKPDNAARAAAVGAAEVVATPGEVGAAVDKVLRNPATAAAARVVAADIATMNSPDVALELVLQRAVVHS